MYQMYYPRVIVINLTQNPDSIIFEKKNNNKNHLPKKVDYNYLVKEVSHLLNDS